MLRPLAGQLEDISAVFSFLKGHFKIRIHPFSILSNSCFFHHQLWVFAYARFYRHIHRCRFSTIRILIPQLVTVRLHFFVFYWLEPNRFFCFLYSGLVAFNAVQWTDRFIMIIFFNEIGKLPSGNFKSIGPINILWIPVLMVSTGRDFCEGMGSFFIII